ncbi:transposable element Tcb2 transposase [Trichonephila clavipes]|nr:transposable element Tcb2 transposase [Trichonephila clavipes]
MLKGTGSIKYLPRSGALVEDIRKSFQRRPTKSTCEASRELQKSQTILMCVERRDDFKDVSVKYEGYLITVPGTAVRKVVGGRLRTTTAGDDLKIIQEVKRDRHELASAIAQQLCTATGRQVSRFTVARRFHKGGLFALHPDRCLPRKVGHRRHHLQWYTEHNNWTTDLWSRVLFTYESRFSTRSDSQRVPLAQTSFFMDGKARPQRTLAVDELLESENITRMDWPTYSPDLNPIEHV